MKVVGVDGTIIDVFGPFPANKNDAEILKIVFEKTEIEKNFRPGDVIVLDRGFRDVVQFLKSKHFDVRIPEFINKGTDGQLTSLQGNKSRLVTKIRYAIEVANGRMKNKWQLFSKIIPSILSKHLMADYKIGAAMLNAYRKPIICDKNDFANIGQKMTNNVNTANQMQKIVKSKLFEQIKKHFENINPMILNFPRFNQVQMKNFALGIYAINQAVSYTAEHIKLHGHFQIYKLPNKFIWSHFGRICVNENFNEPILIFAKIKSRFRGKKTHSVYILYDSTKVPPGVPPGKLHYYCECQHGNRTVGCCSHVMSVVWYFGHGQYLEAKDPASHLNEFFNDTV